MGYYYTLVPIDWASGFRAEDDHLCRAFYIIQVLDSREDRFNLEIMADNRAYSSTRPFPLTSRAEAFY
jgi:hypothetical protein